MPSVTAHDPEAVTVSETGAGRFQVEVNAAGTTFLADEPVEAGGLGSGPNPYDLLASALGACTVMTMRLYAERKGWPLKTATVRVLHARTGLDGRDRFAREIALHGPLDTTQRTRLIEIAGRCPVHRSLERGAEIITITAQPPQRDAPSPQVLDGAGDDHRRDMDEACCDG
ncbi:MAG: OsmC family protein [Phenylobacterium sp.]|nr:OsmC family protein [Phenylobacterium sp.]